MTEHTKLQSLLHTAAGRAPDKIAIRFRSRDISYSQLNRQSSELARGLSSHGVVAGDRIALFLPNCPEAVMAMFACYKIGAVAVPLNYRYVAPEAIYAIEMTAPKFLIFHEDHETIVDSLEETISPSNAFIVGAADPGGRYPSIDKLFDQEPQERLVEDARLTEDHPALILLTSGSTGRPKGVVHSHHSAFSGIDISRRITDISENDTVLVGKPISHAGGLETQLMPTLLEGGEVVLEMKPTPAQAVSLISRHCVTQYAMMASDFLDFIEYLESNPTQLPTLRNSIASGDAVPIDLHHRFRDLLGWEVMEGCGMTEVGTYYAMNPRYGRRKWGSLGLPCPQTSLRIIDNDGHEVRAGVVGEIVLRTPAATANYWQDPETTRELFRDGWLLTGDLGYSDDDDYVWFVGRKKLMIVRRGSNISPVEVENAIDEHPLVHASVVVGVPDKHDGHVPVACVAPLSEAEIPAEDDLRAFLSERLAAYMTPTRYLFIKELPRTGTGKFDRHRIKEMVDAAIADGRL